MISRITTSFAQELHTLLNPLGNSDLKADDLSSERLLQILAIIKKINETSNPQEIINSINQNGLTPLAVATLKKYTAVVKSLIEAKADVNLQNEDGNTLLMFACSEGCVEIATALVEAKADINVRSHQGNTALNIAIKKTYKERTPEDQIETHKKSHLAIVTQLIDAKADLNKTDEDGNTPLITAAENWRDVTEIGLKLIAAGVDLNIQNAEGDSALIWAAKRGRVEIVKKLLESGAKVDLINHKNETALDVEEHSNVDTDNQHHIDVYTKELCWQRDSILFSIDAMLIKHGAIIRNFRKLYEDILSADPNNPDTLACLKTLVEQHKSLSTVENNPLLLSQDELKEATAYLEKLKKLSDFYNKNILDAKTDLNMQGDGGRTLLMHAGRTNNLIAVSKLINGKADVNARDKIGGTALMYAVKKGCQEAIKLIEAKADLNIQDNTGRTALIRAIEYHNTEAAIRLIDAKADFNMKDYETVNHYTDEDFHPPRGRTPLIVAVQCTNVEMIKKMIEAKVDINAKLSSGETALMLAAYKGNAESMKALIEAKASLDIQSERGMTALMCAAKKYQDNTIVQLIEAKADLNIENALGDNAFYFAIREDWENEQITHIQLKKWEACTKLIEAGARVNKNSHALFKVIKKGKNELAKKLIQAGINLELTEGDYEPRTVFDVAIDYRNMSLAALLIQHNVKVGDPKVFNKRFYDFVMSSADPNNYQDMMILLETFCKYNAAEPSDLYLEKLRALSNFYNKDQIEEKIDLNIKNNVGLTPLMFATKENNLVLLTKMISAKADLNLQDNEGKTALMHAMEKNHKEAMIKLFEAKADLNIKMKNGNSLIHLACNNMNKEMIAKLIEYKIDLNGLNNDGYTPLMALCIGNDPSQDYDLDYDHTKLSRNLYNNRIEIASQLIDAKADINIISSPVSNTAECKREESNSTALHLAASRGRIEIVDKLIAAGADVNKKDANEKTPLLLACEHLNIECALKLIKLGANVNCQDKNGMTLLMKLSQSYSRLSDADTDRDYTKFAIQLIECKADLNIKDNDGKTALIWAANTKNSEVITKMIEAKANLNIQDCNGKTALMNLLGIRSFYSSQLTKSIEKLIVAKADLNIQDNEGMTMLMRTCAYDNNVESAIECILKAKPDIELINKQGETAFDILTKNLNRNFNYFCSEYFPSFALLLNAQARFKNPKFLYDMVMKIMNEDLIDNNILICLKELCRQVEMQEAKDQPHAITSDEFKQASYYLKKLTDLADFFDDKPLSSDAKIDLNFQGPNGLTPLMFSLKYKYYSSDADKLKDKVKIMKLISAKADLNIQDHEGKTALMHVNTDNVDIIEKLINEKADLNIQDNEGNTVLLLNIKKEPIAKKLIEANASLHVKNKKGMSALLLLAESRFGDDSASELVNLITDLNVQDNEGNTALMHAIGDLSKVKQLLAAKVNLDIQNNNGETALMLASKQGSLVIVEHLIEAKANLNLRNKDNLSALMILLLNDHEYHGKSSILRDNTTTIGEQATIAKKLIEAGADFEFTRCIEEKTTTDTIINKTESALDLAIKSKHWKVSDLRFPLVKLLLGKDAKIHNPLDLYKFLRERDQGEPDVLSSLDILCSQLKLSDATVESKDQPCKLTEEQSKEIHHYFKQLSRLNYAYNTETGQTLEAAGSDIPKDILTIIGSYTATLKDKIGMFAQPKDIEKLSKESVDNNDAPRNGVK